MPWIARSSPSSAQRADHLGHLCRVALGLHLLEDVCDAPVLVDDEGGARISHVLAPVHRLLLPHAILLGDLVPDVGEEGVRKIELLPELHVRLHIVGADAEHFGFQSLEARHRVAKLAGLDGAARRVVLGIEEEHDRTPTQTAQLEWRAGIGVESEIWRGSADGRISHPRIRGRVESAGTRQLMPDVEPAGSSRAPCSSVADSAIITVRPGNLPKFRGDSAMNKCSASGGFRTNTSMGPLVRWAVSNSRITIAPSL